MAREMPLAMDVQPRAPQHGARRHHASNETGDGRIAPLLAVAKSGGLPPVPLSPAAPRWLSTLGRSPIDSIGGIHQAAHAPGGGGTDAGIKPRYFRDKSLGRARLPWITSTQMHT